MTIIRPAGEADLPAILAMLADDALGAARERATDPLPPEYGAAFADIERQSGNMVLVAERDGAVVGCLQLTLIPNLSLIGTARAQIEGVRVASHARGQRIGEKFMRDAIARARAAGAGVVQLTTDRSRIDAQRFYERLGFSGSHVGMKLKLT
jgi:ribosomal protein S18 acetylase RimI-like enzyme